MELLGLCVCGWGGGGRGQGGIPGESIELWEGADRPLFREQVSDRCIPSLRVFLGSTGRGAPTSCLSARHHFPKAFFSGALE